MSDTQYHPVVPSRWLYRRLLAGMLLLIVLAFGVSVAWSVGSAAGDKIVKTLETL